MRCGADRNPALRRGPPLHHLVPGNGALTRRVSKDAFRGRTYFETPAPQAPRRAVFVATPRRRGSLCSSLDLKLLIIVT